MPGATWSSGFRTGADVAASTGTPVHAVAAGEVVAAGSAGSYGYQVVIRHDDGLFSQYAHLSRLDVRVGDRVTPGREIGLSGPTGNSSGPISTSRSAPPRPTAATSTRSHTSALTVPPCNRHRTRAPR
ncbi:M23 family metallopeptidase [Streptomyces sp. NPDC058401]|uniref:M23 family metallopeptidase n=1 Tax=Streptomyces sp. NPDC058401 TaxID=3346480 RepID=UPI00366A0800